MFGGIGGAIKNLGEKAEGILEEQKKKVEELAIEKRNAAAAMLEQQKEKIGDLLWQSKSDAENLSAEAKQAVDGFEDEIAKEVNKVADDATQHVSSTVDEKLKESEEFLDEKREEAVKQASSAAESVLNPSSVLGKAKGFLNYKKPATSDETPSNCWNLESKNENPTPKTNTDRPGGGAKIETPECTICYLPISQQQGQVVLEECGHRFHEGCIRLWMKQKRTCPFCAGFSLLPEEYPRL